MIDWINLPFNHAGRWEKNQPSIFNPSSNVTWPQFIVEMIIYNRVKYIKSFPKINYGPGWSSAIQSQVRTLVQQANILCNYFPHPQDEPLVYIAFKNCFRDRRIMKIGQPKFVRLTKSGKCTICQDEKDVVKCITAELDRLLAQRNVFADVSNTIADKPAETVTFKLSTDGSTKKKLSIEELMALENKAENG